MQKQLFKELVKLALDKKAWGSYGGTYGGGGYGPYGPGMQMPMEAYSGRGGSVRRVAPWAQPYMQAAMGRDLPQSGPGAEYGRHLTGELMNRAPEVTQQQLDNSFEGQAHRNAIPAIDKHQGEITQLTQGQTTIDKDYAAKRNAAEAAKANEENDMFGSFRRNRGKAGYGFFNNPIAYTGAMFGAGSSYNEARNKAEAEWGTAPEIRNREITTNKALMGQAQNRLTAAQKDKEQYGNYLGEQSRGITGRAVQSEGVHRGAGQQMLSSQMGGLNQIQPRSTPIKPQTTPALPPMSPGVAKPISAPTMPSSGKMLGAASTLPKMTMDHLVDGAARYMLDRYIKLANANLELLNKEAADLPPTRVIPHGLGQTPAPQAQLKPLSPQERIQQYLGEQAIPERDPSREYESMKLPGDPKSKTLPLGAYQGAEGMGNMDQFFDWKRKGMQAIGPKMKAEQVNWAAQHAPKPAVKPGLMSIPHAESAGLGQSIAAAANPLGKKAALSALGFRC